MSTDTESPVQKAKAKDFARPVYFANQQEMDDMKAAAQEENLRLSPWLLKQARAALKRRRARLAKESATQQLQAA